MVEHSQGMGLVLAQRGGRDREGYIGVVGGDEGDGGVGKEAGEEGGEVPGGCGGERVEGVKNKEEF